MKEFGKNLLRIDKVIDVLVYYVFGTQCINVLIYLCICLPVCVSVCVCLFVCLFVLYLSVY